MYYPYFRGKQFELILLRDNAEFLAKNNIHPIIEPVKRDFSALTRSMKAMNENRGSGKARGQVCSWLMLYSK
ncbi:MAG: sce7725 family protein [bacterium]